MLVMSKNKKTSGKHAAPRKPVQLPEAYLKLAQELAEERPMPVMWLLVELIRGYAESKGRKDLPTPPWQKGE